MAKIIDTIREELVRKILSFDELEEVMSNFRYYLVEKDDEESETKEENIIKYTNYSGQLWVRYENTNDLCILLR